jgi:hypothetical protein
MTTDQLERSKQHASNPATPSPDPALKRLDRLVGRWKLRGHPLGSDECTITGMTTFRWLHDGDAPSFFLLQEMDLDYDGKQIKSHELIGYEPKTKAFSSFVYSNMAPDPWPYSWDVQGDNIRIVINKPPMDATFTGKFAADGKSFSGGWRPNPGADEKINSSYDVTATRVD